MTVTYKNADGLTLTMRQGRPFFLSKLDGTGNLHNLANTFKAPSQDGAFFVDSSLDMRNITIEGSIVAGSPDEAYTLRQQLLRVFTPKLQGTLFYRDRKIGCVVEDVKLAVSSRERMPHFFISLLCPSPFFESVNPVVDELAVWEPLFHFVLEIPPGGIEFGARQPSQIITLINAGDAPTGCEIVFSALGVVENPELLNTETGEYVRINKSLVAGEEVHVFTHFAGKRVVSIYNGVSTNAFASLDVGSTFLQLAVGTNLLRYDTQVGLDLLEVRIITSIHFLGVELCRYMFLTSFAN
jgi:hypothetical protein